MQLILSHRNIDFDGLAAMVAAKKFYPRAKMVLTGKPGPAVGEFLALYKDTLPFLASHEISRRELDRAIIVDTNSPERLGEMEWVLDEAGEIIVYDHHPQKESINATKVKQESVGAVTTILVEELLAAGVGVSAFEATIFALGIYQDTGSLTHPGTTSRDARVVAWLLEQGANLTVVADFLEQHLSEEQQALLNKLLSNTTEVRVNGILILVSRGQVDEYINGLSYLTSKLLAITGVNSLLSVVQMGKRVHVVGRTRLDCVPMNSIMAEFGGGGHPKAAAATVKEGNINDIYLRLVELLQETVRPLVTAATIMSYPVKVVLPDTTIKEAGRLMLRYGHTGLPVQDNDKLVGMVSRRDVDKALHHGLGHAPVKGFMSGKVYVIGPDTPLPEIQRLMVQHDVGRLPVVAGGEIVGIVSRSDVLRTLHGEGYAHPFSTLYLDQCTWRSMPDVPALLKQHLDEEQLALLAGIGRLADENNWGAYLVGGFVRDLLLGVPNYDLDIVVEGNAPRLAEKMVAEHGGKLRVHEKFQTATVILSSGLKLDLATARKEFYEYPAALPAVEETNLREDLYRRDFTVNAMAVSLNPGEFGTLVDFFCGYSDLEEKRIRVLHNLSFVEDPTRILRAVRFEQRYDFHLEPQTAHVMKNAIGEEVLKNISPNRVWTELKLIFAEKYPVKSLQRLARLKVWPQIIPGLEWKDSLKEALEKVAQVTAAINEITPVDVEPWIIYLTLILMGTERRQARNWLEQLSLVKEKSLLVVRCLEEDLVAELQTMKAPTPGKLHNLLHNCSPVEVAVALCRLEDRELATIMYRYLALRTRLPEQIKVNGDRLRQIGVKPGPVYGEVLFALEQALLGGEAQDSTAQERFVRRWLTDKGVLYNDNA